MAAPLILLPPSERKAPGGSGPPWAPGTTRLAELDEARERVLAALARALRGSAADRQALLGVSGDALAEAVAADHQVRSSPTCPAIERYTGVLYDALDARTLPATSRRRLARQVLVLSGLFGAVAPTDPIPTYKLKMGASLPGLGRLAPFWRPHLDAALAPLSARRTVWNLLPGEHAAAWTAPGRAACEVRVRFLDEVERGGERRLTTVSHWNKLLKGALVRHLLATQLDDPAGLAAFEHPEGYRYEPGLTEQDGVRVQVALVRRRS